MIQVDAESENGHRCGVFDCDATHRRLAADFVRRGLEGGRRVWYVADTGTPEEVSGRLRSDGVDVEPALRTGQFAALGAGETYLTHGVFEPRRVVDMLRDGVDAAVAEGYGGLSVTGEMSWATRSVAGAERLEEYETAVDDLFATRPAAVLCQFDRRAFDNGRLVGLVRLHKKVVSTPLVFERGALRVAVVPGGSRQWIRLSGEADSTAGEVLAHALALTGASMTRDLHLDLTDLRFADVRAMRQFARAAHTLEFGRKIVLHAVPAVMRRIVALCWPDLAALEVIDV